jgi:hypothetical protein
LFLLFVLLAFLFLPSFIVKQPAKDVAIYTLLVLVLLIGVYELADTRRSYTVGILLALIVLLSNSVSFSANNTLVFLIRLGSLTAFFGLLLFHTMARMARTRKIRIHIIYAAISGYLLLGLMGGLGFRLIHHFYPHSFMLTNGLEAKIDDLTYFSFMILSTVGYGDITPVTPPGQSLAILISVCGQMYTAIVIAIIIGKLILDNREA